MIELEPTRKDFLVPVPNEMRYETTPSWWQTFSSGVAYNNMPLIETVQEEYRFGQRGFDPSFKIEDHVQDKYLPYFDDLARAKDLEHLRFLEQRVQNVLDRRSNLERGAFTASLASGFADPLFFTAFVPMLNVTRLGATALSAAGRLGTAGFAYGVVSEARRAPFAVADEEWEAAWNIGATTALSTALGPVIKGAPHIMPFLRSTVRKSGQHAKGERPAQFVDSETGELKINPEDKYNPKSINPFGSPVQRLLSKKWLGAGIKEKLTKLAYNSSIGLRGQGTEGGTQSVYQRSFVYTGIARQLEERLRDLHIQSITNGRRKKARQVFGAYAADFNPFNKDFDNWIEDTITKYIDSTAPTPRFGANAMDNQQKQAATLIRDFYQKFDADFRDVGLLMDDARINVEVTRLQAAKAKKAQLVADIEDNVKARGSQSKNQASKLATLSDEMDDIDVRISKLEDLLDSPTRKNYVFSIYYDKLKLKGKEEREALTKIFADHYEKKGVPLPRASAEKTLKRIMEESADDLEDARPTGVAGNSKHLRKRKTDIDEHMINDFMVKNMDVFYTYAERAGRKIEFHRAFEGRDVDEVLSDIAKEMRRNGNTEEQIADVRAAFTGEYDRVMGSLVRNPDRFDNASSKFAQFWAGVTYLGEAGINAIADLGTIVLSHGMKDVLRASWAALDSTTRGQVFKEARNAGVALDMARNVVMRKLLGDSVKRVQATRMERTQEIGNRFFYTANFLGPITTALKVLDQILVNDKFIRLSKQLADGTIDARDKEYLFRYGFDEDLANYVNDMPTQNAEGDDFLLANTDAWPSSTARERDMLRRYQAATAAHADNAVVMGQAFDRPLIMDGVAYIKDNAYTQAMRKKFPKLYEIDERASSDGVKMVRMESGTMSLPFTFMNFIFGANNKIMSAVIDPDRRYRLQGAVALIGLSYLSLNIKDKFWWRRAKENWADSPEMMARLIDHSGLVGFYGELGYMGLSVAAGISDNPEDFVIPPKFVSPDPDERLADSLTEPFGAPVGLGLDYYRIANDFLNGNYNDAAQGAFYSAPFLGVLPIKNDMRELMIGTGRY